MPDQYVCCVDERISGWPLTDWKAAVIITIICKWHAVSMPCASPWDMHADLNSQPSMRF